VSRWRWAVAILLLALVGVPLAMPFVAVGRAPSGWAALAETSRLALLARNTLLLVAGTLALAAPAGVIAAVLLYRTDLPLRRLFRFLLILTLFIPLPLFASGWQAALGSGGWLSLSAWTTAAPSDPDIASTGIAWKPWAHGLPSAIWIHAVAGLPWIVLLVGHGLCWVERELEEDALLVSPAWRVLLTVTLRRSRAAIAAALVWVALQTATEITVTDMLQVRTFAEEVYNQFVRTDIDYQTTTIEAVIARAVAVSLPATLVLGLLVWWAAWRWERRLPSLDRLALQPWTFSLGWGRWPCVALVACTTGILVAVPVGSLVWRAGLTTPPQRLPPAAYLTWSLTPASASAPGAAAACWWANEAQNAPASGQYWSAHTTARHLVSVLHVRGRLVLDSLCQAAVAGLLCAALACVACWLATGSRSFRALMLLLVVVGWSMPGPVIGLGLKETIAEIVSRVHSNAVTDALHYGPSPLPVLWADVIRFFPAAVALLWPVVRLVPSELLQSARVDGASPFQELRRVVWPLTATAFFGAGAATAVLSLGELSAGKLAVPPGSETFTHEVFIQMHNGVANDLPALCLVLLAVIVTGAVIVVGLSWLGQKRRQRLDDTELIR
jgi:iron(III) transport system permease protein